MSTKIDEQTWKEISTKLTDAESLKVLREIVKYAIERLKSRIDEVKSSRDVIAFFSKGKELLTVNVTRTNLRVYFQPSCGALFSKDEKPAVEKASVWEGSFQKASGKYRAMTAWVSKEEHIPGIKTLIDRIPTSP
jgi:Zn/Cd-binding protein ZinT